MKSLDYYFWLNSDWAYLGADRLGLPGAALLARAGWRDTPILRWVGRAGRDRISG